MQFEAAKRQTPGAAFDLPDFPSPPSTTPSNKSRIPTTTHQQRNTPHRHTQEAARRTDENDDSNDDDEVYLHAYNDLHGNRPRKDGDNSDRKIVMNNDDDDKYKHNNNHGNKHNNDRSQNKNNIYKGSNDKNKNSDGNFKVDDNNDTNLDEASDKFPANNNASQKSHSTSKHYQYGHLNDYQQQQRQRRRRSNDDEGTEEDSIYTAQDDNPKDGFRSSFPGRIQGRRGGDDERTIMSELTQTPPNHAKFYSADEASSQDTITSKDRSINKPQRKRSNDGSIFSVDKTDEDRSRSRSNRATKTEIPTQSSQHDFGTSLPLPPALHNQPVNNVKNRPSIKENQLEEKSIQSTQDLAQRLEESLESPAVLTKRIVSSNNSLAGNNSINIFNTEGSVMTESEHLRNSVQSSLLSLNESIINSTAEEKISAKTSAAAATTTSAAAAKKILRSESYEESSVVSQERSRVYEDIDQSDPKAIADSSSARLQRRYSLPSTSSSVTSLDYVPINKDTSNDPQRYAKSKYASYNEASPLISASFDRREFSNHSRRTKSERTPRNVNNNDSRRSNQREVSTSLRETRTKWGDQAPNSENLFPSRRRDRAWSVDQTHPRQQSQVTSRRMMGLQGGHDSVNSETSFSVNDDASSVWTEQTEQSERTEQTERTERTEHTEWTERTERTERTEQSERVGRSQGTGRRSARSDIASRTEEQQRSHRLDRRQEGMARMNSEPSLLSMGSGYRPRNPVSNRPLFKPLDHNDAEFDDMDDESTLPSVRPPPPPPPKQTSRPPSRKTSPVPTSPKRDKDYSSRPSVNSGGSNPEFPRGQGQGHNNNNNKSSNKSNVKNNNNNNNGKNNIENNNNNNMFPPGMFPPGMFPPGMVPPGMLPPGMDPRMFQNGGGGMNPQMFPGMSSNASSAGSVAGGGPMGGGMDPRMMGMMYPPMPWGFPPPYFGYPFYPHPAMMAMMAQQQQQMQDGMSVASSAHQFGLSPQTKSIQYPSVFDSNVSTLASDDGSKHSNSMMMPPMMSPMMPFNPMMGGGPGQGPGQGQGQGGPPGNAGFMGFPPMMGAPGYPGMFPGATPPPPQSTISVPTPAAAAAAASAQANDNNDQSSSMEPGLRTLLGSGLNPPSRRNIFFDDNSSDDEEMYDNQMPYGDTYGMNNNWSAMGGGDGNQAPQLYFGTNNGMQSNMNNNINNDNNPQRPGLNVGSLKASQASTALSSSHEMNFDHYNQQNQHKKSKRWSVKKLFKSRKSSKSTSGTSNGMGISDMGDMNSLDDDDEDYYSERKSKKWFGKR